MGNGKKRKHSRSRSRERHSHRDRSDAKMQKMQEQLDNLTKQLQLVIQTKNTLPVKETNNEEEILVAGR